MDDFRIFSFDEAARESVYFDVEGVRNFAQDLSLQKGDFTFNPHPVSFDRYKAAFDLVRKHIIHGNSFLLNLTFPTDLETNLNLYEIFHRSKAAYRLFFKDQFVVFSPESFIKIRDSFIYSFPMKGTIDAGIPEAERKILSNEKELWEHNTIVDLIRNDLSMVSGEVEVARFRYVDRIRVHGKELLQVSSEIRGKLPERWKADLGNIILSLLPAGSICGAPKRKTLEIISEAEGCRRNFFTGVFGIYDGSGVNCGVMIRFIEKEGKQLRFRSGGGITGHSIPGEEYSEMLQKVYVPII